MSKPTRILALCDSPARRPGTAPTGFARVASNIFKQWSARGIEVDVWAIHFDGWGYKQVPWELYPGGNQDWNSLARLNAFLNVLASGNYTHVWMLSNADALCVGSGDRGFPRQFQQCCQKHNIHSTLYFPIDAEQQEPQWMDILGSVDVAATFTEFGRKVVRQTLRKSLYPIEVVPHGLEEHFRPPSLEERQRARRGILMEDGKPFAKDDDFLILNVNKNEWRKDPLRSLEILRGLIEAGARAKLILRMEGSSVTGGIHILRAATQLGLRDGKDFVLLDPVPEENMPALYQCADLYLTTTLGEGWGLGITEALACGTPVATPANTSCGEIGCRINTSVKLLSKSNHPVTLLPLEPGWVCGYDTRLRRRVDIIGATQHIVSEHFQSDLGMAKSLMGKRVVLPLSILEWLSWKRIADQFLELMGIKPEGAV